MPLPLPVRAKGCVQACYNAAIPYMVPELPTPQKEALSKAVRAVMLRTQVAIRDWKLPIPDVDDLHLVGIGRVRVVVAHPHDRTAQAQAHRRGRVVEARVPNGHRLGTGVWARQPRQRAVPRAFRRGAQFGARPTQPLLAENSLLPVVAGQRPYLLDSYMFRILRDDDPSFGDRLWRDLRGRRFPAVILERDPHTERGSEWYRSGFFGRGFIDELERHYREVGRVGERVVYVPKQPPPFDE